MENSPNICVVTPCLISLRDRGSTIKDDSECESMLMKPGATAWPVASMITGELARLKLPTAVMRSPFIPTSARLGGRPLPSYTVPPLMMMSNEAVSGPRLCAQIGADTARISIRVISFWRLVLINPSEMYEPFGHYGTEPDAGFAAFGTLCFFIKSIAWSANLNRCG